MNGLIFLLKICWKKNTGKNDLVLSIVLETETMRTKYGASLLWAAVEPGTFPNMNI